MTDEVIHNHKGNGKDADEIAESDERRRFQRAPTNLQTTLIANRRGGPPLVWSGRILNLSRSGALIESKHFLAEHTRVTLIFKSKNDNLEVLAEVVHSTLTEHLKLAKLGVRFISINHVGAVHQRAET